MSTRLKATLLGNLNTLCFHRGRDSGTELPDHCVPRFAHRSSREYNFVGVRGEMPFLEGDTP